MIALGWAVLVVVAVHSLRFPGSVPDFVAASGGGMLLDATPAFAADEVHRRLTEYGEAGRRNYSFRNMTVDIVLPFSVLPFLILLAGRGATALSPRRAVAWILVSLPLIYLLFDLLENGLVLALLNAYPSRRDALAGVLPYVTIVKRAASLLAIVVPLAALAFASLVNRRRVA